MNKEYLGQYLHQSGFLDFEINELILILKDISQEPIARMISTRKALYYNYKEKLWTLDQFKKAIREEYYNKDAYVTDVAGHKHADPTMLLVHYQTFSKEEDELMLKANEIGLGTD